MFCRSLEKIRLGPSKKLWDVLREYGVDGPLLLAVKLLYFCSEVRVRVSGAVSPPVVHLGFLVVHREFHKSLIKCSLHRLSEFLSTAWPH